MSLPMHDAAGARVGAPSPPPGVPRSVVGLAGVAAAVVLAVGTWLAADVVAPVVLALVLTIAVVPVDGWVRRRGGPGLLATLAALVAAYSILLVLVLGTVVCLTQLVRLLPQYTDAADELGDSAQQALSQVGLTDGATGSALQQLDLGAVTDRLAGVLSWLVGGLGNLFLLLTLMFFFVTAVHGFRGRTAAMAGYKPALAASLGRFVTTTQRYLVVTAVFGAVVAVLDAGALWLLGVPLPLVWGFFSFVTNFIPNIGFVIGVIPPALLALLESGPELMLVVVLVYCLLNVTIQTFIQPRIVGASVGLSAEMTFLSLVVWTFLLGPLGAVLAVPMTLLLRALLLDADERTAWVQPLISAAAPGAVPRQATASEQPAPPRQDDGLSAVGDA